MNLKVRSYHGYIEIKVEDGGTLIDSGFLNKDEAKEVLTNLKDVVSDMEYYMEMNKNE